MDCLETVRKCRRRVFENYSSSVCRNRKVLAVLVIIVFPIVYYIVSKIIASLQPNRGWDDNPAIYLIEYSLDKRLMTLRENADDLSATIQHDPLCSEERNYLPFVGNGLFGVVINKDSHIHILEERVLTLPLMYYPIVKVDYEEILKSAKVVDYINGIAHTVACYTNDICITSQYYAHRTLPNIFVQDIEISNPAAYSAKVYLSRQPFDSNLWPNSDLRYLRVFKTEVGSRNGSEEFEMIVGPVTKMFVEIYACIVAMKIPNLVYARPGTKHSIQVLTAICEDDRSSPSDPRSMDSFRDEIREKCVKFLKMALKKHPDTLREEHMRAWQQLWTMGVSISPSKAKDALNGDKINATMYYVLSNTRSPFHEYRAPEKLPNGGIASLSVMQGCYGNIHHTLQAKNLWSDLSTFSNIQKAASNWLLTLEKQGCDKLVTAGALGVMEAMVLSFGSFRFTNQHLEFNMHPKFLHRDFTFRRIWYGNSTQVNVSVHLQEDNKAILLVSLELSDRSYYACDGGCLDGPVMLGYKKMQFPVKLTEPVTAVLYISPDKQHLDDLRHAIHVHQVGEAPAHEHSVIALHKHGHHLGGLPTFFWVSVGFLIIIFHLFLFKLIYNEYCGGYQDRKVFADKHKVRYSKL